MRYLDSHVFEDDNAPEADLVELCHPLGHALRLVSDRPALCEILGRWIVLERIGDEVDVVGADEDGRDRLAEVEPVCPVRDKALDLLVNAWYVHKVTVVVCNVSVEIGVAVSGTSGNNER